MKITLAMITLTAGLTFSASGFAQTAPATAPAGTSGMCKDGSYSSGTTKKGACSKHGGVKDWYVKGADASPAAMAAAPAAPAPAAAAAAASPMKTPALPAATAAAGGGPGKVWVNTSSKTYHCSGSKWYGTTKAGSYMTEAAAKAAGNHADHGKGCS